MANISGTQAKQMIDATMRARHPELSEAEKNENGARPCAQPATECESNRRANRHLIEMKEKAILFSLIEADRKMDAVFTPSEVENATTIALDSYAAVRKECALPDGPSGDEAFNRCIMMFFDKRVRDIDARDK